MYSKISIWIEMRRKILRGRATVALLIKGISKTIGEYVWEESAMGGALMEAENEHIPSHPTLIL